MSFASLPVGHNQKKVIEVSAEYVDAMNDSLKWLIVFVVAWVYNKYLKKSFGGYAGGISQTTVLNETMVTAGLMMIGLLVYHFVVEKVVVFLPRSGQSTYYMARKRTR
jgi:hypothetical protein